MNDGDKQIKLLIVDDEKGFAEILGKRFGRRGIHVETAYRGEDAVRMLREKEFDVAVLDLKLEGMDGIEILKVFKMLDPDLPVLMLTGHGCEKAAAESIKLGVADYLSKPVDFSLLLEKVKQVCSQKGGVHERDKSSSG
ncbi:response regulator [Maridesulfovibrio hydrothermalis]|uniref:Response regulator receiver protein n=1 Tax=Maridesulfovibrio hydrothermalis AM13 = DSM 14728 TaxID=1121451 RepID=L0RC16_9BACT|nr:response regulator [Maridesulfovibrio hydrothermalis]CCO23735.1 Response regulator receiver protein [Maridesulfovibrio hydrothermalis AM13 = DSM 14728]